MLILFRNANNERVRAVRKRKAPTTELGRRIARAMDERGWTQQKLAKLSGLSQSFLSGLMSGENADMSTTTARRLGVAFGDPSMFAGGTTGQAPIGVDEFLASELATDVTDEEARILRGASWVPSGKVATKGDWYVFLRWLRGLGERPKGDQ